MALVIIGIAIGFGNGIGFHHRAAAGFFTTKVAEDTKVKVYSHFCFVRFVFFVVNLPSLLEIGPSVTDFAAAMESPLHAT
jgi:hypothetical protein